MFFVGFYMERGLTCGGSVFTMIILNYGILPGVFCEKQSRNSIWERALASPAEFRQNWDTLRPKSQCEITETQLCWEVKNVGGLFHRDDPGIKFPPFFRGIWSRPCERWIYWQMQFFKWNQERNSCIEWKNLQSMLQMSFLRCFPLPSIATAFKWLFQSSRFHSCSGLTWNEHFCY